MNPENLTEEQMGAVNAEGSEVLVIAGPGSGKTTVLAARAEHIRAKGDKYALVTYTRAAAQEIRNRVEPSEGCFIGTLHQFMLEVLKRACEYKVTEIHPKDLVVIGDDDDELLRKTAIEVSWRGGFRDLKEAVARHCKSLNVFEQLAEPDKFKDGVPMRDEQIAASHYYRTLMYEGLATYDFVLELGRMALQIWHSKPLVNVFPWDEVLVDEAQDMAEVDQRIYQAICAGGLARVFMVGDPCQAIFGFRGGKPEHMGAPMRAGRGVITMSKNFRSDPGLERCTRRLRRRMALDLPWCELKESKDALWFRAGSLQEIDEELVRVASQTEGQTIGILYKTNKEVEETVDLLERNAIPVRHRKLPPTQVQWHLVAGWSRYLVHPDNDHACEWALLQSGIDPDAIDAMKLKTYESGITLNGLTNKREPCANALDLYGALLQSVPYGLHGRIGAAYVLLPSGASAAEFSLVLQDPETTGVWTGDSPVTVCTVHSAKGQEFDRVLLPNFGDAAWVGKTKSPGHMAELRRLAYVAMTRARHTVQMLCPPQAPGEMPPLCRFGYEALED
ncbi:MAG: ATP-dependent helicase [Acidobacteria bacterium]|nr:ATP-dependent helicase [Acidobacteriota bacterium]